MSKKRGAYVALFFSLSCLAITGATKRSRRSHRSRSNSTILRLAPFSEKHASEEPINIVNDQIEETTNQVDSLKKHIDRLEMLIVAMNKKFDQLEQEKSRVVHNIHSIQTLGRRNSISLGTLKERVTANALENSSKTSISPKKFETIEAEIQQTVQEQKEIKTTVQQKESEIKQLKKELETCNEKVGVANHKASISTLAIVASVVAYAGLKTREKMGPKKLTDAKVIH